jgi:hypothetical protein
MPNTISSIALWILFGATLSFVIMLILRARTRQQNERRKERSLLRIRQAQEEVGMTIFEQLDKEFEDLKSELRVGVVGMRGEEFKIAISKASVFYEYCTNIMMEVGAESRSGEIVLHVYDLSSGEVWWTTNDPDGITQIVRLASRTIRPILLPSHITAVAV